MIDYEIIYSKRKTISIEITPAGKVLVRSPKRVSEKEITSFLEAKEDWILKHLHRVQKEQEKQAAVEPLSEEEIKALKESAKYYFPQKVEEYALQMGVTYGKITIRFQHSLWGSCSSKGNLNFNCLLMRLSPEIRDYVIVHELSHRKHMDHSNAFWKTVESVFPDYKERRHILKTDGQFLMLAAKEAKDSKSKFYTYMLRCADGSLYTGYTTDLEKRVEAHNLGKGAKYTRMRRPVELVYFEEHPSKQEAMRREALIKQMTKKEKEKLILQNKEN